MENVENRYLRQIPGSNAIFSPKRKEVLELGPFPIFFILFCLLDQLRKALTDIKLRIPAFISVATFLVYFRPVRISGGGTGRSGRTWEKWIKLKNGWKRENTQ